jgi:hypothetical protein
MTSTIVMVFRTIEAPVPRAPSEIIDDILMTEAERDGTACSPCRFRYSHHRSDVNTSTFRTTRENEDAMADLLRADSIEKAEFDSDFPPLCWTESMEGVRGRSPSMVVSPMTPGTPLSPETPPSKTRKNAVIKDRMRSMRFARAIRRKMGATKSGPNSPTYDRWNQGYANRFKDDITKLSTWEPTAKRKRSWGDCDPNCHWCVNKIGSAV